MTLHIEQIEGLRSWRNQRRGILFLTGTHRFLRGPRDFNDLGHKERYTYMRKFESWLEGITHADWYHGYNRSEYNGKYSKCFQFEDKGRGTRFYGFIIHPLANNRRFVLCVLSHFTTKNTHRTDESILAKMARLANDPEVLATLRNHLATGI